MRVKPQLVIVIELDALCHSSFAAPAVEDPAAAGYMRAPVAPPVRARAGGLLASPNRALEPLLESEYEQQSECGAGGGSVGSDAASGASSKRVSRTSDELSPERLAQRRLELEAEFARLLDWLDECESLLEFVSQSNDESCEPAELEPASGPGASAGSCPQALAQSSSTAPVAAASASASVPSTPTDPASASTCATDPPARSRNKKLDIDQQISLVKVSSYVCCALYLFLCLYCTVI